jgi:maleate isomerase
MNSWRGRIGIVVSPPNTVCEIEFNAMAPDGVTVHASRLHRATEPRELTIEVLKSANDDLERATASLRPVRPSVVAFPHTLGSMVDGPGYDKDLVRQMERAAGCPSVTTSIALLEVLEELHIQRLAIAAPYAPNLTRIETDYLRKAMPDLAVVSEHSVGVKTGFGIGELPPDSAYEAARKADSPEAQAVFISGTNWMSGAVLDVLEADLGKPVFGANQITLWASLRRLGVRATDGPGSLLRDASHLA